MVNNEEVIDPFGVFLFNFAAHLLHHTSKAVLLLHKKYRYAIIDNTINSQLAEIWIMTLDDLKIVNYCHPNCKPLQNIMRLPKDKAFALAYAMAEQNKNTTAFYRFADFENYYPERLKTDELLFSRFLELGGKPFQEHPLSFVLHGSDYLSEWFDRGTVTEIPLSRIPSDCISFTYGDSQSTLKRRGDVTMLTKDMLFKSISDFNGTIEEFLTDIENRYRYIEAQVWNDDCLRI